MDPKRKKNYIIIIVVCVVIIAGLWAWNSGIFQKTSSVIGNVAALPDNSAAAHTFNVTGNATSGFSAPGVFPANPSFDFSVLDSAKYKQLQASALVVITPEELGRDNPFVKY